MGAPNFARGSDSEGVSSSPRTGRILGRRHVASVFALALALFVSIASASADEDAAPVTAPATPTANSVIVVDRVSGDLDAADVADIHIATGTLTSDGSTTLVVLRYVEGDRSLADWNDAGDLTLSDLEERDPATLPTDSDERAGSILRDRTVFVFPAADPPAGRDVDPTLVNALDVNAYGKTIVTGVHSFRYVPRTESDTRTLQQILAKDAPLDLQLTRTDKARELDSSIDTTNSPLEAGIVEVRLAPLGTDAPAGVADELDRRTLTCVRDTCSYFDRDGVLADIPLAPREPTPTSPPPAADDPAVEEPAAEEPAAEEPAAEEPAAEEPAAETPSGEQPLAVQPDTPPSPPATEPDEIQSVPSGAFTVHWQGHDAESGVAGYRLKVRTTNPDGTDGMAISFEFDADTTAWGTHLAPGSRTCFSLKVTDRAGNASPWTAWHCVDAD
jgi:hypothetical protein